MKNLIPNPKPVTFGKAFANGFALSSLFASLAVVIAVLGGTTNNTAEWDKYPIAPATAGDGAQAAALHDANDCWTGEAPKDVWIPGHVVVKVEGGEWRLGGERFVDKALRQIDGEQHGLTVYSFCR